MFFYLQINVFDIYGEHPTSWSHDYQTGFLDFSIKLMHSTASDVTWYFKLLPPEHQRSTTALYILHIPVSRFWPSVIGKFSQKRSPTRRPSRGSLLFCDAVHPWLCDRQSSVKIGFVDDVTLSGSLWSVEQDVITIMIAASNTDFHTNTAKCKVVIKNFTQIPTSSVLNSFVKGRDEWWHLSGLSFLKAWHRMQQTVTRYRAKKLLIVCLYYISTMHWCCWRTVCQSQCFHTRSRF